MPAPSLTPAVAQRAAPGGRGRTIAVTRRSSPFNKVADAVPASAACRLDTFGAAETRVTPELFIGQPAVGAEDGPFVFALESTDYSCLPDRGQPGKLLVDGTSRTDPLACGVARPHPAFKRGDAGVAPPGAA